MSPIGAVVLALVLAGYPSVDLGDSPQEIGLCNPAGGLAYFTSTIWPKYLHPTDPAKDCASASCHGNKTGMPLETIGPIDDAQNYRTVQNQLDCGAPRLSYLLVQPLDADRTHGGGTIFTDPNDPAIAAFLGWFSAP